MSDPDPRPTAMRLDDDDVIPALDKLTQPHELPPFDVDEGGRPFATAADRDDPAEAVPQAGTPLTITESQPT